MKLELIARIEDGTRKGDVAYALQLPEEENPDEFREKLVTLVAVMVDPEKLVSTLLSELNKVDNNVPSGLH